MTNENYSAKDITVLEGLEAVRKRPGMYIGSTDKYGLHHLVYEVVDNSVDEHMAGVGSIIKITINKEGSVTVEDDGRGMPVDPHPVYKRPAMEIIVTKLHAGGKFDNKAYAVSGGLHGVGISVVSALSKDMTVDVKKEGKIYSQSYGIGIPKADMKVIGTAPKGEHGTKVTFLPDNDIFTVVDFDFKTLGTRFRETCFLNAGLKIIFTDERGDKVKSETYHYAGGLSEFVSWLNKTRKVIHTKPIYFKREDGNTIAEVAIQYSESYNENIQGFVNTINTIEGGTHVAGLKSALTRVINDYGTKKGILKKGQKLTGDDAREGITAVISIKMQDPQFEGQTKTKLGNGDIKGTVDSMATSALSDFFEENPSVAKSILNKATAALKAREAAKKAKDLVRRKNALGVGSGLPGKLADCSSRKKELTELYVVEGDSAGGTAKGGRDRETQAILPLRGKVLNVEKSNQARALGSEQISNLITAMGTGVGESFDIAKLRYNKIIIMTDADVDGQHIKALLLTLLYRYTPQLIEAGHIFVAVAPFFKIKKGNKDHYVYSGEELKKKMEELGGKGEVSRFKGLGEMNDEQLWNTTMNPKKRRMKQISIEDAVEADETFSLLMGDAVAPRRQFIEENADKAEVDL
ncbi:DNA topoisomerase (ATP-hydrolyzing) subunit B [archaeon]|jgi:DNA gyrase subunit B|nr:DNA topoisomerase (ATP-hydrolyzing) subunit B [archaeon]MBT6182684.1 DNA topoisomerase (ATP-hydrolyzing) subunit B [archaeon]MBT6606454.1 DNA topoisomerase (ATP-hydrolyzing) subunit B [archaeon]MBT7251381.1 DNA topoisomerase (ATP-hydrolyzing) subunit B [archaeon]MBT7660748.1 DNA topoisomerase (ATP-hydrolyzing) subunit B [archaeon]